MASIDRNGILAILDSVMPIVTPLRTTRVAVRTRQWPGELGLGTPTDTNLLLQAYVKVRELTSREVASSGGQRELGDVQVEGITAEYPGGGLSLAQIAPEPPTASSEIIYVLSGAINGEYRRISVRADKPFSYELTLRRLNTTP